MRPTLMLFFFVGSVLAQEACPVKIDKPSIYDGLATVHLTNTGDKKIQAIALGVRYYDSVNIEREWPQLLEQKNDIKPGQRKTERIPVRWEVPAGEKVNGEKLYVDKILFSDGSEWNDDGTYSCNAKTNPPKFY